VSEASTSLRILSWNVAMMERSAQAPFSLQHFEIEAAIRRFVLDEAPDIVCWQELPNQVPFVETLDLLQATTQSHSGRLATLVAKTVTASTAPEVLAVDGVGLLTTFPEFEDRPAFSVANVHLEPGRGGVGRRLEQLGEIVSQSPTERILIIGDTNMRVADVEFVKQAGFAVPKPKRPTWNSKRNRFQADGFGFTAYFTRPFVSPGLAVSNMVVHDKPTTVDGKTFYWSDHFALSATITVTDI